MTQNKALISLALVASIASSACSGEEAGSDPVAASGTPSTGPSAPAPGGGMSGVAPAVGGTTNALPNPVTGGSTSNGGDPNPPPVAGQGGNLSMPQGGGHAGGSGGTGGVGGNAAMGGETGMAGASQTPEITLDGEPPETQTFSSISDFDLLPATPMYSRFHVEGNTGRVQCEPLNDDNWAPDFEWRTAPGRDPELNEKHLWARAELKTPLKEWYYDVTFDYCGEADGESPFALEVNGEIVAEFRAAPSNDNTCARSEHVLEKIPIPEGATVLVLGKSHSNLTVGEGAAGRSFPPCPDGEQCTCPDNFDTCTWAWARARWYSAEFAPSADAQ